MLSLYAPKEFQISASGLVRIEEEIKSISLFLKKNPEFFSLAKFLNESRELNDKILNKQLSVVFVKYTRWNPWSSVVSHYTKLDETSGQINYNPKKYSWMDESEVVGNITHEVCHHFGSDHPYKWTRDRKMYSPYYIGYLYEFLHEKLRSNLELKPILISEWREYITKEVV